MRYLLGRVCTCYFFCFSEKINKKQKFTDSLSEVHNNKFPHRMWHFSWNLQIFPNLFEGLAWVNFTQCRRFHLGFASMNISRSSISAFPLFSPNVRFLPLIRPCKTKRTSVVWHCVGNFTFLRLSDYIRFMKVEFYLRRRRNSPHNLN